MKQKRILLAVRPEDDVLVSLVLGGYFDFKVCHSLREAVASLDESFGLIVGGVHFDHGAMFDLLTAVTSHPTACSVPFFLVLREETRHSASVIEAIRSAGELRGVDKFIDLRKLRTQMDEQQMLETLRNMVRDALSPQN